uniref:Uncharacterized protein n=1 Tax=Anopheles quadriannulatus TaxID=34691 RepID=A0A182XRT1_ANOQN
MCSCLETSHKCCGFHSFYKVVSVKCDLLQATPLLWLEYE